MKNTLKLSLVVISLVFLSSCSTISYCPKVSLDISQKTIAKSAVIELFKDNTDIKVRKNPFAGASVTNEEAMANDLALEVTNAIVLDFSQNAVFNTVKRKMTNPDYIITGEINKFKGVTKLTNFGLISSCSIIGIYSWVLGIPVRKNETNIELVVTVWNTKGEKLGAYTGLYQDKQKFSMYKNSFLAIPSQTNKSFSTAVAQIREQITNDLSALK
jgi:hypothetical protein